MGVTPRDSAAGARSRYRSHAIVESVRMSLEAIRANKLRSVLTCLGIIIGVSTVIAMMSIVNGINGVMTRELNRIGANSFFMSKFPAMQISMDWRKFAKRPDLTMDDVEALRAQAQSVEQVSPGVAFWNRTVKYRDAETEPEVFLVGAQSEYLTIGGIQTVQGRNFTTLEDDAPRNVALLGADVVDRLFPRGSPIGEHVRTGPYRVRVIGVLERRGSIFGFNQDAIIIIPIHNVLKHNEETDMMELALKAMPGVPMQRAIDEVRAIMRTRHKLKMTDPDDFEIATRESITRAWSNMTGSIFAAAIGIASISLLVGGVGIMNIMLVSVRERTREIGVRKALGARHRDIQRQFLIEATTLSALGGVVGIGVAIGGLIGLEKGMPTLPVQITPFAIALAFGFSVLVGVFFGVFPARRAARLDPIESLRYE